MTTKIVLTHSHSHSLQLLCTVAVKRNWMRVTNLNFARRWKLVMHMLYSFIVPSTLCARATHSNFALYALENFKFNSCNKLKKLKVLPFLRMHSSFSKRTVSTLDGALD